MIVDLAPPERRRAVHVRCWTPGSPALTSVAGIATGLSVSFTTTPAATGPVWWDFGDGTWDYVAAPGATTHVYSKAGTYTASASSTGKWVTTNVTAT